MAFIVKKNISGKDYYSLNENKRIEGRIKTKTLAYLGKTKKEAEKRAKEIIKNMEKEKLSKEKIEKEFKELKEDLISEDSNKMDHKKISIEEMASFCKRKGFVYPSSEIYGGLAGFWDFGPLGVELFNNIKQNWWKFFVNRENVFGIDCSVIAHPRTWKASGHISSFSDVAVICKKCKKSTKLDKSEVGKVKCECGENFIEQGEFNLLFKTDVGALSPFSAYLRGETAQGMFLNFKSIVDTGRIKLPFGIAQIGKCFRNEIAPRDFLFRSREFTIAEIEFFILPDEERCSLLEEKHLELKMNFLDEETQLKKENKFREISIGGMMNEKRIGQWHAFWLAEQLIWLNEIGLDFKKMKIREHTREELSHYSSATFDIDYEYSFGSKEIAGNADRGQYDLSQHIKESKKNLDIFDENSKKRIIPKVIEPTFGMERVFLAVISEGYFYDEKRKNVVLKLDYKLAPLKAAIFPIVKTNEKIMKISKEIYEDLKKEFNVVYDSGGSIGRRYARNDEVGTPFCITVDEESSKTKEITIRNRDTTQQIRIKISELRNILRKLIEKEIKFEKAGKIIS